MSDIEYFKNIEVYLPILPDSIIVQYRQYNKTAFYREHQQKIIFIQQFIDSMNAIVGQYWSIDTLSIDNSIENFGTAAYQGRTLFVSSGYFFMYSGTDVFRSIITHEFGHIFYSRLTPYEKNMVKNIWMTLETSALIYLFHEGEYSHNARFGGHPEDSPAELFASAFNLFTNQPEEFNARLKYVADFHLKLINEFRAFIELVTTNRTHMTK